MTTVRRGRRKCQKQLDSYSVKNTTVSLVALKSHLKNATIDNSPSFSPHQSIRDKKSMRHQLPTNHGLTRAIEQPPLIHRQDDTISITDAQFEALSAGVATGASILLVSPTSTGKTEVGLIAIATWLTGEAPMTKRAVYLVSHRALARQKFNELRRHDFLQVFALDEPEIGMSNGDQSVDGRDAPLEDPLSSRLLIATYEKFLALLAASGLRQDMTHYCIVADEFQLIGDSTRGQDVEILFTMIKEAKFGQFVGLSAVLESSDLRVLSEWMEVHQVFAPTREVPLHYELVGPDATYIWTTDGHDDPLKAPVRAIRSTVGVLKELERERRSSFSVAVFCMTKARVEELASEWGAHQGQTGDSIPLQPDLFEEQTILSEALAIYVPRGFAVHTADLIEGERALVESALDRDDLAVVFATTTLAQGLNYSFKTVIFDSWTRYNFARRQREPILRGDFHNIAGRAGRLGKMDEDSNGRVIFFADKRTELRAATHYLSSELDRTITGRINPERFDQVALQLLAAGIVSSQKDCLELLKHSLSGYLAQVDGIDQDGPWREKLSEAISKLATWGFIAENA